MIANEFERDLVKRRVCVTKTSNKFHVFQNFVEQNPHWETDWMSDRQKAFEKSRANKGKSESEKPAQYAAHTITFNKDGFHTKRKESPTPTTEDKKKKKDKKKKNKRKSSSSSSSDSSSSDSEPVKKKKTSKSMYINKSFPIFSLKPINV